MTWPLSVLLLVAVPLAIEARRARRNDRAQRARGGLEPEGDVYKLMRVAYPLAFLTMIAEGTLRDAPATALAVGGLVTYALAKGLKWWAILTLGPAWTFRVIVVPGARLASGGPYRFLRHPNYVAVVMELSAVALMTGAAVSGPLGVVLFGVLIERRIRVEERALGSSARHPPCGL